MMEHLGSSPEHTVNACRRLVEECDLLLLIVAFRRGWVPGHDQGGDGWRSVTAYELEAARHKGIPVRVLMARETWPGILWENDQQARDWVLRFRANLNQIAEFFEIESLGGSTGEPLPGRDFQSLVRKVLLDHRDWLSKQASAPQASARIRSDRPVGAETVLTSLEPLLAGLILPRKELLKLYELSAPFGWDPPPPVTNSVALLCQCVYSLARAPRQGGDGIFPLLRFVRLLHDQLKGEAAGRLNAWLDDAIGRLALDRVDARRLRGSLVAPVLKRAPAPVLLVQMTPRLCRPGFYSVKVWLFGTGEPACLRAGEEECAREELPRYLDGLREELARRGLVSEQVAIEFLLPRDLLCSDVDQWKVELDFIDSIAVGAEHRVVVRSLERACRPKAAVALRSRWQALRGTGGDPCRVIDSLNELDGEAVTAAWIDREGCGGPGLYTALRSAPGLVCVLLDCPPEPVPASRDGDVLNTLLAAGIPVVLWARRDLAERPAPLRPQLSALVDGKAWPRLPDQVWDLRKQAVLKADALHLGRHVTLLWDDPRRVSPDFDEKHRFRAPS